MLYSEILDYYKTSINVSLLDGSVYDKLNRTYSNLLKYSLYSNIIGSLVTVPLLRIWKSLDTKSLKQNKDYKYLISDKQLKQLSDIFVDYSFEEIHILFKIGCLYKEINDIKKLYVLENLYDMYKNM